MDFQSSNPVVLRDLKGKRIVARPLFRFDYAKNRLVPTLLTNDGRELKPIEGEDGIYQLGKRRLIVEAVEPGSSP
jgi:hypothetical protein